MTREKKLYMGRDNPYQTRKVKEKKLRDGRTYNKYTFKIGVGEQGITVAIKPVTDSYIPS